MFGESYSIKTHVFEGPLDLLLDLIEKRKLHISDISLSQVTDDFIGYIKNQENFPLGLSAHFILVASTLLLIKSKSLLPTIDLTPEEEASIVDLEARLREYQEIKRLSVYVKDVFGKNVIFPKGQSRATLSVFAPDGSMSVPGIFAAAQSVILSFPKKELRPEVTLAKVVTLEETILALTERITKSLKMSFKDFAGHGTAEEPVTREKKVEIIVGFLAVLELAKQGVIAVSQEGLFDDIHMETETVGVPNYM